MKQFFTIVVSVFLAVAFVLPAKPTATQAAGCLSPITDGHLERLEGATRFETAVSVSQNRFPADGSAAAGVLVRSDDFADGVVAAPLAHLLNATLLLTPTDTLSLASATELTRAVPISQPVYLMGGTSALSDSVEQSVRNLGYGDVRRVAGFDRYETAVAAAQLFPSAPVTQVGVTRGDVFADAVSLGGPAARDLFPIVLSRRDNVPQSVLSYLQSRPAILSAHLAGGTDALSEQVATQLNAVLTGGTTRYGGADRYETSVKVTEAFYGGSICAVSLATGLDFADALVAGAHSGQFATGLLLTRPNAVPTSVQTLLEQYAQAIVGGYVYGGERAVEPLTLTSAQAMIEPASFVFWGDSGELTTHWTNLASVITNTVATQDIDGLFMLGDNIYPDGATSAADPKFASLYEGPLASLLNTHQINVVLGNHDSHTANGQYELDYAASHPYWHQPDRYYDRTLEHVKLVALDTSANSIDQAQLDFLQNTANNDPLALHTIVLGHHPAYSSGVHGNNGELAWVQDQIAPVLASSDVEFYLSGHEHDFEALQTGDGVNYIVSGGSSSVRPVTGSANTLFAASAYHVSKLDVYYSYANLTVLDEAGAPLYTHRFNL